MERRRDPSGVWPAATGVSLCQGAPARVLVVTDDEAFLDDATRAAGVNGSVMQRVVSLAEAASMLERASFDVIAIRLPVTDTCRLCKAVRAIGAQAGILAAYDQLDPRPVVSTLECGADDVVSWPVAILVLAARMSALGRRLSRTWHYPQTCGKITVDDSRGLAFVDGEPVALSPTDLRLLGHFVHNPGRFVTAVEILSCVFGTHHAPHSSIVRVHLTHLRQALGSAGAQIRTVRGLGYRLVASERPELVVAGERRLERAASKT